MTARGRAAGGRLPRRPARRACGRPGTAVRALPCTPGRRPAQALRAERGCRACMPADEPAARRLPGKAILTQRAHCLPSPAHDSSRARHCRGGCGGLQGPVHALRRRHQRWRACRGARGADQVPAGRAAGHSWQPGGCALSQHSALALGRVSPVRARLPALPYASVEAACSRSSGKLASAPGAATGRGPAPCHKQDSMHPLVAHVPGTRLAAGMAEAEEHA